METGRSRLTFSSVMNFKRTIDDRGKSVECRSINAIKRQASRDPALAATADRIAAEALVQFKIWHGVAFGVSLPLLLIVSERLLPSDPFWLHLLPVIIFGAVAGMAMTRHHWRKVSPGLTRILIEEGICASCMYPLEGLSEDSDGLLVCPECAASWRRSRVIRFAPIARRSTNTTVRSLATFFLGNMRHGFDRRGIRDDHDSPRAVIALRSIRKIEQSATGYHKKRLRAATHVLRSKGRILRFALAALLGIILVSMVVPFALITRFGSSLPLIAIVPLVFAGFIYLTMAVTVLFSDLGRSSKLVRREFLTRNMCPCCAADLEDQSSENDDRTVCPACGAAWLT